MAKFNNFRRQCAPPAPTFSRRTGAYASFAGASPRTYGFPYSAQSGSVFYEGPCPPADCEKCGVCLNPCGWAGGCWNPVPEEDLIETVAEEPSRNDSLAQKAVPCGCEWALGRELPPAPEFTEASGCGDCAGCSPCPPPCPPVPGPGPVIPASNAAMLVAGAMEGWIAPLQLVEGNPGAYWVENGEVVFQRPGRYIAVWTMNLPANHAVSATVRLNLDGRALAESAARVDRVAEAVSGGYSGQAIFSAAPGARLRLESSAALSIAETGEAPVFALTLLKVSP